MLGDKVIKSDSPLVSSKIDFADFLAMIVNIQLITGIKREWNEYERIINVKF